MTRPHEPNVGDTYYRFEDNRTSSLDWDGEWSGTNYNAALRTFTVLRRTPCGVRLSGPWGSTHFMHDKATRRFACPTVELALESYRARKLCQIGIYEARIQGAKLMLEAAEYAVRRGVKPPCS